MGDRNELVEGLLGDEGARRRFANRNIPPSLIIAIVVGLAVAVGALVLAMRCESGRHQRERDAEETARMDARHLWIDLARKLDKVQTFTVVPDAGCPPSIKRISVLHQSFLKSFNHTGVTPVPPVQSTPFAWIHQGETLFDDQLTKQVARLRELLADPYLAIVVPTKELPIEQGLGHFEGQIQIIDTATVKPVCAMTVIFDVPQPPTSKPEATAWSEAFWKAADPALAKAAPGARFRLD